MATRNFKDHTCKAPGCDKIAEKDRFGLYKTYCSDECNPRKKQKCENTGCNNKPAKDKYGNYMTYCSDTCRDEHRPNKIKATYATKDMDAVLEKRIATVQERYGVDNVSKDPDIRLLLRNNTRDTSGIRLEKTKITNIKNHGVESTNSLPEVKQLKKDNYKIKTGYDHPLKDPLIAASVSQKNSDNAVERLALAAITKEEKYGDENYNNRPRFMETCEERFGVSNPSQNAEVHERKIRAMYTSKEYILPSGNSITVQGYEPQAIDELLQIYEESDIKYSSVDKPRIKYILNNREHYYFPDLYIPKENLIIEVKSEYTYNSDLEINLAKRDACIAQGYDFRFMIMDKK